MKLLMNLSTLGPQPTGLGVYAQHCAQAACRAFEAEVVAPPSYHGGGVVVAHSPADIVLGASRGAAWRRWRWSRRWDARHTRGAERLVYSPTHHGLGQGKGQVLTLHDLIALRFPRQHPAQYLYFRHVLPRQLRRCRGVVTVSQTSRNDIHEAYGVPLESIHVVPNGVDRTVFRPPPPGTAREPFLLAVGAAYPHKNLEQVLRAAPAWSSRYRLLIASCRGAYREQLEREVRAAGLQERVSFLGYLGIGELVRLYQTCRAFVYPSLWEGFGIPPLEAMACGAPVIASDIPAHREVLGSAATLVPLDDDDAWAAAFDALQQPPAPVAVEPGPARRFSWEHSAQRLVAALTALEPRLVVNGIPTP
ncbi:glycosyltransferase family 4 protein [Azohydromonas aeria]|uniref:glycosyltransferase family 4 protein n=1 Tax=Azohydromonas aeria TaxID=2590212 RepID=UPI0012F7D094|nr:glycosyltransferase family 1 protein [Azohydromonas aeria]